MVNAEDIQDGILSQISVIRDTNNLPPLFHSDEISAVSADYAEIVSVLGSYVPDLDGETPSIRLMEAGISFVFAGEAGFIAFVADVDEAMEILMNEFGELINDPEFTKIGISVLPSGNKTICVINFTG